MQPCSERYEKRWSMVYSGYILHQLQVDVRNQTVTEVWGRETVSWWQINQKLFIIIV